MTIQNWEDSGHNKTPEADLEYEEQLRVILYCMEKLRVLIREEENVVNRAQLRDLEHIMMLWLKNRGKSIK